MGKGSNVKKAQRARADKLKKLNKAGNAGGGAEGMVSRKATASIMANAKAEREEFRVRYRLCCVIVTVSLAFVLCCKHMFGIWLLSRCSLLFSLCPVANPGICVLIWD